MVNATRIVSMLCLLPICSSALAQSLDVATIEAAMPKPGHGLKGQTPGTEQWIVHFQKRSFDLSAFRRAMYANRPWAEVEPILAGYRAQMTEDQSEFKKSVERLGGKVYIQYWIVNAAAIEIPHAQLGAVRKLANVARLEPNLPAFPLIKTATNSGNHNSDAVNALGFKGAGISTCIVDTGLDSNCGNKNRPHRTFFLDGDVTKTNRLLDNLQAGMIAADNTHQHGTGVAGIAAGGTWDNSEADHGHAPHAGIVGISISNNSRGSSDAATMAKAWQWTARDAAKHKIKTANNSYSGWSDPTQVTNQAMDSCSLNADVMIVVAGGNFSASTSFSQSNCNGLAVAATNATSHTMASFSSRGPIAGDTQRTYPDMAACGVSTIMPDNDAESLNYVASGTSMAAPQVCGAATLLRSAVPTLKADQTKAILLATALDISTKNPNAPYNSVNAYGYGFLRDLPALKLAQDATGHGRAQLTTANNSWSRVFIVQQGKTYRAVANWMRQTMTSKNWSDINIEILDGSNNVIEKAESPRNLYEVAVFRAAQTGVVTMRVTGKTLENGMQDFAWAFTEGSGPPIESEYEAFGMGCPSGPLGNVPCISNAWTQTLNNQTTSASRMALLLTTQSLRNLTGIELYMRSRSGTTNVNLTVVEFDYNTVGPGTKVIARGSMSVGTTAGTYRATFTPFLNLSSSRILCVVFDNADKLILPISPTGQKHPHFEFTSSWSSARYNHSWQYQLVCDKGRQVPVLDTLETPIIGKSFQIDLRLAPPGRAAALVFGLSNTMWNGQNLPWQYAPSCNLYVSPDLVVFQTTKSDGTASITVPVPNQANLAGVRFYNQFLITSPVNGFGMIATNAASAKIGEF